MPALAGYMAGVLAVSATAVFLLERSQNPGFGAMSDALWWGIVTLTTVGYGDRVPVTPGGRLVASLLALFGIGMLGVVTGKIAGVLVERRIKEGRGLTDALHLSRHTVLLGWKADMRRLVQDILTVNPDMSADRLVLVNTAEQILNDALRDAFRGLVYLHGDIIDPSTLKKANLRQASRVVILADEAVRRSDHETDARTVMAALTVKSLAPDVYTCAEVLEQEYAEHLRLARCDEIVMSRTYSRHLLVSATRSAGITHVLHHLLDVMAPGSLATMEVPPEFVGRTVGELAAHLKERQQLLVGLLENTGRARAIKRQALREAQKTANVATLVDNLRQVKDIMPNRPHITPPDDHVIAPHTLAIVIGHTLAGEA